VDDAAAYLAKAQELGGTPVQEAMEIPGMGIIIGMFLDPEGNRFGVIQPLHGHG
jgi:predicted enzyme related to lactoylglutathione lyase